MVGSSTPAIRSHKSFALRLSQGKSRGSVLAETSYVLAFVLPFSVSSEWNADQRRGAMRTILIFTGKWNRWYRVLRYGKGFRLFESVRYGLWLARS